MPITYNYSCSPNLDYQRDDNGELEKTHSKSCDFKIIDNGPHIYLKIDGKEIGLDQHDFVKNAEDLSKKPFKELVESEMIVYKKDELCLNCLSFKEECNCDDKNLVRLKELEGMMCPKCKKGKIIKTRIGIS